MRQTVEVDGRILPVANLVRRGAALAVDLCIAVFVGSLVFYAISRQIPLDANAARIPILLVVLAAVVYLIWARDHVLPSYGRRIFRLLLVRPGGSVPARLSRPVTAYDETDLRDEYTRAFIAVVVVAATSLFGLMVLAHGLSSTTVYRAALAFTMQSEPFAARFGAPPRLGAYPRALLIGKERAYVQADASWGAGGAEPERALEFYLRRGSAGDWEVAEVKAVEPSLFGRFALAVADEEVPVPATRQN